LEREYLFIDVISTFLRAIRVGAIHIHHGAVVLAHYGRLEVSFDTCSKAIVDVLREESVMNDNPDVIVTTVTQALQEVSYLFFWIFGNRSQFSIQSYTLVFDGLVRDDSNSVLLAKLLSTCFIVRGSQLSILRRLDNQYIVEVHTNLISWIGKRIATYENNKNKKSLKTAIGFFRVLMPLLGAVQNRDALKM
jgi:cohesin complex subunit SA-1/2